MSKAGMRSVRALIVGACAWACVSAVVVAQPEGGGPPPAMVRLDDVRLERLQTRREVTGELRAARRAALASEEEGLVISLAVEVGDRVEEGAELARLDSELMSLDVRRLEAELASRRAAVDERRAQLEKAHRDLERLTTLQTREGASKNEVDDARTQVAAWTARLAEIEADLESISAQAARLQKRLGDMTVRAPFAGYVVSKGVEVGEWVQAGDPVVEIVELDQIDVYLDVPERFVGALQSADAVVQLRIPSFSKVIESRSAVLVAAGDRLARTFPVRVRLDNRSTGVGAGLLRPGMSVVGLVPTGEPADVLTVHKDAVLRNDAGAYVYFNGGGMAAIAPIEMLFAEGDRVAVRSPLLKAGMAVVVEGNERVFPGQPLAPLGPAGGGVGVPGGPGAGGPGAGGPGAGGDGSAASSGSGGAANGTDGQRTSGN
ncbi:MAG: efflux RND transporter periplasmic adaptor subunit [Planctomycetota bacterium]|nr:efflux RND transporter periplasmic adaptor subunit [Planctomycetota bacterium]